MNRPHEAETKRTLLHSKYSRYAKNGNVAFVDESYVSYSNAHGGKTFYLLSAYILPFADINAVRDEFTSRVSGYYWHTNEAHRNNEQEKIRELCECIAAGGSNERNIVAFLSPIEDIADGEELAREQSFRGLLAALQPNGTQVIPRLLVCEERRHQKQRSRDARTVKILRSEGLLQGTETHFTSPSVEPLLWIPDIVAFAQNHWERGIQSGYKEILEKCVTRILVK